MNIGQAADASGVSPRMIRHYESLELLPTARRTEAGYRLYGDREVNALRFIRHARDLGFSIEQISELLGLWENKRRSSRRVKALAQGHIQDLEQKVQDLQKMKAALEHLVHCCHGDDRPDCPILDSLASPTMSQPAEVSSAPHRKTAGLRIGR